MEKPIVSIWGLGPSYRLRVKKHIEEAINSGYKDIMDFIILTDDVQDFDELCQKTNKIKAVINIHEERKKSLWPETEFIPNSLDEENYGKEYLKNLSNSKDFCYSLKRYSLQKIAELGYTKFILLDGDVIIKYDKIGIDFTEEEFWSEFETPVNSMKGCVKETVYIEKESNTFKWAAAMGHDTSCVSLQTSSILLNKLHENHNIKNENPIISNLDITEGPFRYYNFENIEKVKKYFEIWDEVVYLFLSNPFFKGTNKCGGYMLCDYLIYGVTNIFCKMQTLNFPNKIYSRRVFYEDRYFIPPMAAGLSTSFHPASNLEEFYEKNKNLIDKVKDLNSWPHIEHN